MHLRVQRERACLACVPAMSISSTSTTLLCRTRLKSCFCSSNRHCSASISSSCSCLRQASSICTTVPPSAEHKRPQAPGAPYCLRTDARRRHLLIVHGLGLTQLLLLRIPRGRVVIRRLGNNPRWWLRCALCADSHPTVVHACTAPPKPDGCGSSHREGAERQRRA